MSGSDVTNIVAILALAVSVITLFFLVAQIRLLRGQVEQAKEVYVAEHRRSRRQSTLEFLSSTMEQRHSMYNKTPYATKPEEVQAFLERLDQDADAKSTIRLYLNYFELLACGVLDEIFDIEVVDRVLGSVIISVQNNYEPLISHLRTTTNQPLLYRELSALAQVLLERRTTEASGNH